LRPIGPRSIMRFWRTADIDDGDHSCVTRDRRLGSAIGLGNMVGR
jgi:hypothetical protein